jgi:hypothetical protein
MPPDKTFTQAEVNGLLAKERRKAEAELAELRKNIGERDTVIEAARARVLELEQQHASATGERDALRADLATASATHAEQLAELTQQHAEVVQTHHRERAEREVTSALLSARMAPSAEAVAVAQLLRVAQVEQDATGAIVGVTLAGQRYPNATDAAKAFIAAHPFFEAAPLGGSGSARGIPPPGPAPIMDITKADPMQLASEGWQTPVR